MSVIARFGRLVVRLVVRGLRCVVWFAGASSQVW
jgi:hypothetical protein